MAFVEATLKGDLDADLARFTKAVQDKVLFVGVASMAKVVYEEVQLNASGYRGAHYPGRKTGNLAAAIYRVYSPERSSSDQKTYRVSWNKKKAPHGYLIEFGTVRAPAYPFLRPAFGRIKDAIATGKTAMAESLARSA